MPRIRTIKPEFFRHHELFVAEKESGFPLRIAFAGLWTVADREGRFKWKPIELKLDCLPFDDLDFSRVMDALTTRGFLVRYGPNGEYGCIPGFQKHQVINTNERQSELPQVDKAFSDASCTREARVVENVVVEGKGRERKGRSTLAPIGAFEDFWQAYPRRKSKGQAMKAWAKIPPEQTQDVMAGLERAKLSPEWRKDGGNFIQYPATWLNALGWKDGQGVTLPKVPEKRPGPKKHAHHFITQPGTGEILCSLCGELQGPSAEAPQ